MNDPAVSVSPASAGARPPLDFEELSNTAQELVLALRDSNSRVWRTCFQEAVTAEPYYSTSASKTSPAVLFAESTVTEANRNGWLHPIIPNVFVLSDAGRASLPPKEG